MLNIFTAKAKNLRFIFFKKKFFALTEFIID